MVKGEAFKNEMHVMLIKSHWHQLRVDKNKSWSTPGIEPGTSSTLRMNHTPRPSGRCQYLTFYYLYTYPVIFTALT